MIESIREEARKRFAELGYPTTHDEDWRFTSVAPIARTTFESSGAGPRPAAGSQPAHRPGRELGMEGGIHPARGLGVCPSGADYQWGKDPLE
jgi:hypothetical protein